MTTPSFPRLFSPLTIGSSPRSGSRSRYGKAVTADRRPVIGLTTYAETARMLVWDREFALLHASYIAATERAGGVAVLLPPQSAGPRRCEQSESLTETIGDFGRVQSSDARGG